MKRKAETQRQDEEAKKMRLEEQNRGNQECNENKPEIKVENGVEHGQENKVAENGATGSEQNGKATNNANTQQNKDDRNQTDENENKNIINTDEKEATVMA